MFNIIIKQFVLVLCYEMMRFFFCEISFGTSDVDAPCQIFELETTNESFNRYNYNTITFLLLKNIKQRMKTCPTPLPLLANGMV